MANTDFVVREYNMEDLEMLERSQVFHDGYVVDEALFTAAFTLFGLTYAADFQTVIDDADAIPSGAEVELGIEYVTSQFDAKMELAREAVQKLFTYADLAFKDPIKTKLFGKDFYLKARNSHRRMKELLETAHRAAIVTADQTALLAAGYTAGDIAELLTLIGDLDSINAQQEYMMLDSLQKTQFRVKSYNAVWAIMSEINQASKVVFVDDPAKLTLYLLYPTVHHSLSKPQNPTAIVDVGNPTHAIVGCDAVVEATSYKLYFSEVTIGEPSGSFTYSTENATPSFDYPMTAGKRTYWKIRAFSASSSSDYSNEVWLDA